MTKSLKEIAENILGRSLTKNDGIEMSVLKQAEDRLELKLPAILKAFYALTGNLKIFMSSFQQFLTPNELFLKNGILVFLSENQGVCDWGIKTQDIDSNSALVYVCTDIGSENPEWYSEDVTIFDFLVIIMYYQCGQGGYEFGGAIYERAFENKEAYIKLLSTIAVTWENVVNHNGLVMYQKQNKLIWHFTDKDGNTDDTIFASTLTEAALTQLENEYGFEKL